MVKALALKMKVYGLNFDFEKKILNFIFQWFPIFKVEYFIFFQLITRQ